MEMRDSEGNCIDVYGPNPAVKLTYTDDGWMFTILEHTDGRPNVECGDLAGGTDKEKIALCKEFASYCSKVEIKSDNEVIHHVEHSFFPNWAGAQQLRYYSFDGNKLLLSTPPFLVYGKEQQVYLVWEKV